MPLLEPAFSPEGFPDSSATISLTLRSPSLNLVKRTSPCNEEGFYSCKKARKVADPMEKLGKHLAHAIDMFELVLPALEDGINNDEPLNVLVETNPKKYCRVEFYSAIKYKYPRLPEHLGSKEEGGLESAAKSLEKGHSDARTDNTNKLKGYIVELLTSVFPPSRAEGLTSSLKSTCGWQHPLTGELLTPHDKDWNDLSVQEDLKSGKLVLKKWLHLLFKGFQANAQRLFHGFLQNDLMLQAALCIFINPSASLAKDTGRSRSNLTMCIRAA
ncbi:hypothetical protein CALCODRAFT_488039 [Calocera cornea HHB12733]|uniref:Uncharacterized protein n=1 Tax=Calocera cornea HHB12733 TaxID=1353952 RepID=A0A165CS14_9BASI|nr:hypothetical protein CALCODRAFT_488039 [Calocera cornea HHB12733]